MSKENDVIKNLISKEVNIKRNKYQKKLISKRN